MKTNKDCVVPRARAPGLCRRRPPRRYARGTEDPCGAVLGTLRASAGRATRSARAPVVGTPFGFDCQVFLKNLDTTAH